MSFSVDPQTDKMPFIVWRITIALILVPPLLFLLLLPKATGSLALAIVVLSTLTVVSWTIAALILRRWRKWPWPRRDA